ncbi:ankyrin repeat domain-containing protein [Sporomusa acidovorans]|nr:ankyrin repeat domain-containing protein [Sporomusa acidovorans]
MEEFMQKIKRIKRPNMSKPDFPGIFGKIKAGLGRMGTNLEARHLIYFALILMPAIVGLGAYYGIMDSKAKLEAANLPENQLMRTGVNFTVEDFVKYAGRGKKDITELFIRAGMSPDSYRKNDGFTPLHAAAAYGRTTIVRQLLDKGADINARDKEGQTPLMKAVGNNHADVVTILLQRGANSSARDGNGNSAVSLAKAKNDRRVLEALAKAGIGEGQEKIVPVSNKNDKSYAQAGKLSRTGTSSATARSPEAAAGPAGQFVLTSGYAGNIGVGKSIEALYQEFGKHAVSAGEEFFSGRLYPVLKAYDQDDGALSLAIYFAQKKDSEKVVTAIHVFDKKYKTVSGIGVGATLGELRTAGEVSSISYSDALYAVARDRRIRYELDISADSLPTDWLNGGDTNSLPDDMPIRSIYIF